MCQTGDALGGQRVQGPAITTDCIRWQGSIHLTGSRWWWRGCAARRQATKLWPPAAVVVVLATWRQFGCAKDAAVHAGTPSPRGMS